MGGAKRCGAEISTASSLVPRSPGLCDGIAIIYGPLRNVRGMIPSASRTRPARRFAGLTYSALPARSSSKLKQLYGSNRNLRLCLPAARCEIRFDSVGKGRAGVDVRISDNGESGARPDAAEVVYKRAERHHADSSTRGSSSRGDARCTRTDGQLKITIGQDWARLATARLYAPN